VDVVGRDECVEEKAPALRGGRPAGTPGEIVLGTQTLLEASRNAGVALAVPRGDAIGPTVNRLATRFAHVVLTQDWHPPGHRSFASSHPGSRPFETVATDYGPQILWPDHCVQGSPGAAMA